MLALTALGFLAYGFLGHYLPTAFGHGGFSDEGLISFYYLRLEGLLGIAVGASAVLIFPVVVLGSLMVAMGGGTIFSRFAMAPLVNSGVVPPR